MPSFTTANITVNGQAAIAAAIGGTPLVITRVAVGSGVAGNPVNLTALVSQKMNLTTPQVSANVVAADEVMILSTLDSSNAPTTAFNLTEIGVFATSGGGAELLLAYYQCALPGDVIVHDTGLSRLQIFFSLPIQVGIGANVTITVIAGNPIYIPPVEAGTGITVTAPTDASGNVIKWIVATKTITQATTLFVAPGNNNVAPNFSNIQNAVNYLSGFSIASGVQITINVSGNTYQGADATFSMLHVNGNQITIQGLVVPDVSFSNISSITGSAGAWNVTFSGLSSTANLSVGGWVIVWQVAGANVGQALLTGFHQIQSIAGTSVTIRIPYFGASWPAGFSTNGSMTPIKTILWTNSNTTGCFIGGGGVKRFQNIGFVSKGLSNNLTNPGVAINSASNPCQLRSIGVYGWRNNSGSAGGFAFGNNSNVLCDRCAGTNNSTGLFIVSGAIIQSWYCSYTHNGTYGIWVSSASWASWPTSADGNVTGCVCWVAGNVSIGIIAQIRSTLIMQGTVTTAGTVVHASVYSAYNNSYGVLMENQTSSASATNGDTMALSNNVTYDLAIFTLSVAAAIITGSRIFNQTPPTTLTANGIITG